MRSLIAITASVAMLVAQVPLVPAFAQSAPPAPRATTQYPIVGQTFNAFPNGGDPLSERIAALIVANPKLAPEFVIYMRNAEGLTQPQKLAAEQGLAAAADRLGIKGADLGVPGPLTKDTVVDAGYDAWLIAVAILAVGAGVGIGVGASQRNNSVPCCLVSAN
jgi:hypothetical protein